jgi:ABC-2 type transport system permease protein
MAQIQPVPYPYFPLINNFGDSPITKNLDMLYTRFVSTIDTVNIPRIKKTALLKTSPYTKISLAPALVTYDIARIETDNKTYNDGEQTIAYLLEGSFTSLYKNQILPQDKRMEYFLAEGEPSKVLVVADGDIIVNDVDQRKNEPFELGFDRIDQHKYGNEDFLLNAMAYLIDEEGVIVAKNKEIKLRPLDEVKVREKRNQILLIGLVLPSLIVVLLGLVRGFLWKKKYN